MKKLTFCFLLVLYFFLGASFLSKSVSIAQSINRNKLTNPSDTFPVPPNNGKMIFYVQRTHNINTIIYELNYNKDSTLNREEPVNVYWVRYADDGGIKKLSYIQKNYAYGLNSVCVDPAKQTFKLNFVSYKKRDIYLVRSKSGNTFRAYVSINNKQICLDKIFAKIEGGTFWVPHIAYVEITGKDPATGRTVSEKIIP